MLNNMTVGHDERHVNKATEMLNSFELPSIIYAFNKHLSQDQSLLFAFMYLYLTNNFTETISYFTETI